jgi:excisionase family DNA binding protein
VPHAKKAKVRFKDRRCYSLAEVAGLTGLAISTLYKLIKDGLLKTTKVAGRRIVPAEALDELLGARAVSSREPPPPLGDETPPPVAGEIVARVDLDALARQRIASAAAVAATTPRQINHDNRTTEKGRPPADRNRPSISLSPVKEERQYDDS